MQALLLTKYGDPPLVTVGDTADPVADAAAFDRFAGGRTAGKLVLDLTPQS